MTRVVMAGLASLVLTGCFPWGSCPDTTEPTALEAGVYTVGEADLWPEAIAQLGGVDGELEVTVDRQDARVYVDYVTAAGEERSLTFRITEVTESF